MFRMTRSRLITGVLFYSIRSPAARNYTWTHCLDSLFGTSNPYPETNNAMNAYYNAYPQIIV